MHKLKTRPLSLQQIIEDSKVIAGVENISSQGSVLKFSGNSSTRIATVYAAWHIHN